MYAVAVESSGMTGMIEVGAAALVESVEYPADDVQVPLLGQACRIIAVGCVKLVETYALIMPL